MFKSIQTYFHKRWTAKAAMTHFQESNFGSVLKAVKKPIISREPWAAYLNIYRLIALRETGSEAWLSELASLNEKGWLDDFNPDEKNYILIYMLDRLFGEIDISPVINLRKVSAATRESFAIDPASAKFHIYFKRPAPKRSRFNPENYIWLARPRRVQPAIRFSSNLQNLKTFSLSKGPWL